MKALKIILTIVGILVAAMLIIPIFLPTTAEVKAEIEIAVQPSQIFPSVASFENREIWDPWVSQDATTKVTIDSKPGFVGSTYSWNGEKLGTGKMQVVSVKEESYIESSLWFGEVDKPSLVEWNFTPTDGGTHVVWSFSQETKYPIGRLGMIFGKIFLQQSFDMGLASLKGYLEALPWPKSTLGPITIETQKAMMAMVTNGAGTMETIGEELGELYGAIYTEIEKQQLQVVGPAFVHYLDYDASTGHSNYRAGFPVSNSGKSSGNIQSVSYPEMKVVQAIHTGPYEEFTISYNKMDAYISMQDLEVKGEAFEFYIKGMMTESDPSKWQTIIAFLLK